MKGAPSKMGQESSLGENASKMRDVSGVVVAPGREVAGTLNPVEFCRRKYW